jgi:hypothetical protein
VSSDRTPNCLGIEMQPDRAGPNEVATLLRVCQGCPMWGDCREIAQSQTDPYGVHAGQWWGEPPAKPMAVACAWCDGPMGEDTQTHPARTSRGLYCKDACRRMAWRAKQAAAALSA